MREAVDRLRRALAAGEGETTEFKRAFDEAARQTLCAFANTAGGQVWIGVGDDGAVVGMELGRESLRDWANQIAQTTGMHPRLEAVTVDGKPVVGIAMPESPLKPVFYRGRAYVRSGAATRVASDHELTRWVLERSGQTWDELAEPRASWEDLDLAAIARFRRLCLDKGRRAIPADETDETVLRKLGLMVDDSPSRAALLLFGREPQRLYGPSYASGASAPRLTSSTTG
jgi:ATP-dependent DNA helicase RecG